MFHVETREREKTTENTHIKLLWYTAMIQRGSGSGSPQTKEGAHDRRRWLNSTYWVRMKSAP